MSTQFLSKLSKNYIELLEDDEFSDITIEVDEKNFRAHMNILCYRSPYFRRILTSNKKDNVRLSNISPEIFQIIIKYIYGGIISLNDQNASNLIKVLLAADELLLQELVDYLQKYLVEDKSEWMEKHFELIHRTSFKSNSLLELQRFCTDFMVKSPEKIFKSLDFTSLPEKSLVQLIKRDDLQMKEIEVWEYVIKWGIARNQSLTSDTDTWSDDDYKTMENTLQHCLPLIRFFSMSSKEFLQRVHPYKKLLKRQHYEELLNSHLDPDIRPTENISLPRNIKIGKIIDSEIFSNLNIISTISRWIEKPAIINNNKFLRNRELYLPYKFKLLLRGSRDGFTPKKFHELCDGKPNTVTFMKVKGTEEIIGGYNPLKWKSSSGWDETKDSFIFSFKNENNFIKYATISDVNHAIYNGANYGPRFGLDINISSSYESTNYNSVYYKKYYYEKKIRDIENSFSIEDYEVFRITK